ncbi:unnamed protein product [Gordionus sp. m RMFG-2023]
MVGWNVGTLTHKNIEFVNTMIFYYNETSEKGNRIGIILNEKLKNKMYKVKRCSDHLIWITLVAIKMLRIINAYAFQLDTHSKEGSFPNRAGGGDEKDFEGGKVDTGDDFNEHVEDEWLGILRNHGEHGYEAKNRMGKGFPKKSGTLGNI